MPANRLLPSCCLTKIDNTRTTGEQAQRLSADELQAQYTLIEQGDFMRGWYAERTALPEPKGGAPGRPPKGSDKAVDWSVVDWTISNAELARSLGVARQVVASQRKRHAPGE
ncbi:MAG: hypothetical protein LBC79_08490 [Deltaproteobacteria bacterium]|nr:hypothetical protein [Deltaproteobacteria bacterium]